MSGSGTVGVNGRAVAACWAGDPAAPLLRVTADDWEALGLGAGMPVALDVPGRPTLRGFVASDTFVDPCWVWVIVEAQRAGGPPRKAAVRRERVAAANGRAVRGRYSPTGD